MIYLLNNKAFRHVEIVFIQGNQVRTDQNKPPFLLIKKKICFDQYELYYLGRIKFLHVEMPYYYDHTVVLVQINSLDLVRLHKSGVHQNYLLCLR